jgi:hypothetical protein
MDYVCPVCFFDQMPYPPRHYNICPCCGTEFDNDDLDHSFAELRYDWIASGARWFFGEPPYGWSAAAQLAKVAFGVYTLGSAANAPLNKTSINNRGCVDCFELQYA